MRALHESLRGEAFFSAMEGQLDICVRGDGRGGISVSGAASADSGSESFLTFAFDLDQSYLLEPLLQLDKMVSEFPVQGVPTT